MRCCVRPAHYGSVKLVLAVLAIVCSSTSFAREWTDSTGKFHREAEFVRWEDSKVWLTAKDGAEIRVSFDCLSQADQDYIKAELAKIPPPSGDAAASASQSSVFRLAQYDATAATPKWKHVYDCCGLRAHLVNDKGTIDYWLNGKNWLAALKYAHGPSPTDQIRYEYYNPDHGDPYTGQWAFAFESTGCGCCRYAVWRSDRQKWHLYCYACRKKTN